MAVAIGRWKLKNLIAWLDSDNEKRAVTKQTRPQSEVDRWIPFAFLHLGCLAAFFLPFSWFDLSVCLSLYVVRMFAITGFYHRYFSHRSFKTSRIAQFVFAVIGLSSVQRGPLWWAAHHRRHHAESDDEGDIHSPVSRNFLWAHIGWITSSQNMPTDYTRIRDFDKFPELRFLNRFDWLVPTLFAFVLLVLGNVLQREYPALHTSGAQMLVWGFFISTVLLFHGTSSINSVCHIWGSQRFNTGDNSRNNFLCALITLGEGWHNNHHHYRNSVRQGFYWWEIDLTYYGLLLLSMFGIIWDLKPVPKKFLENQIDRHSTAPLARNR